MQLTQQEFLERLDSFEPLCLSDDHRCYVDSLGRRYRRMTSVIKFPGEKFEDPEGKYAHTGPIGTEVHALFECQVTGDEQVARDTKTGFLSDSIRSAIYDDFEDMIQLLTEDGSILLAEKTFRCPDNLVAGRLDVIRVRPDGRWGILDFKTKSPKGWYFYDQPFFRDGVKVSDSALEKWDKQTNGYTRLGENMELGSAVSRHIIPIVLTEKDSTTHEVATWQRMPSVKIPYNMSIIDTLIRPTILYGTSV